MPATNNNSDFIDVFRFVVCFDPYQKLEPLVTLAWAAGPPQWSLPMHLFLANITSSYPLVLVLFPKLYIKII